jgi:D-beta-D-heptose 7-phosphate kinase/D-beta-D-heptose 1-phosphate adenosyltransferase
MKISIVSGGFDPVHVGHLELFQKARDLSDALWVIVNSDDFLTNKKGEPFMPFDERATILSNFRVVDLVIASMDTDQTVCATLKTLKEKYPQNEYLFCNGGDRTSGENTPEHKVCVEIGIEPVYGLGDKIQSSSWLTDGEAT